MSEQTELPNERELRMLPKNSLAVYAFRCALRAQSLLASWRTPTREYKKAVLMLNREFRNLFSSLDATFKVADVANDARKAASRASRAANAAEAIYYAAYVIRSSGHKIDTEDKIDSYIAAVNVAAYASSLASEASNAAYNTDKSSRTAARADYVKLKELGRELIDASETGPLGDLWHGSPPEWYIEAKEKYNKAIAEWEQEIAEEGGNKRVKWKETVEESIDSLTSIDASDEEAELAKRIEESNPAPLISVYFDNSGFTDEEIEACLEFVSESYRSLGGIGLKVVDGNMLSPVMEEAHP